MGLFNCHEKVDENIIPIHVEKCRVGMSDMHSPDIFLNALNISGSLRVFQLHEMFGDDPLGLLRKAFYILLDLRFNPDLQVPAPF